MVMPFNWQEELSVLNLRFAGRASPLASPNHRRLMPSIFANSTFAIAILHSSPSHRSCAMFDSNLGEEIVGICTGCLDIKYRFGALARD
jgi:hypothetical protein